MTWRTISECLPAELMFAIGIDGDGRGSSYGSAPAPAHAAMLRSEFVATDAGEGETPVAFAQDGGVTVAQTGMGKWADAETPARVNREENKLRSEAKWLTISASLRTILRNKHVAPPTRFAPALATCLFLVIDNGHFAGTAERFAL